jgi:D-alanyl-D-alanine carboxypeptidase (penicillin-binding protein 5/6)
MAGTSAGLQNGDVVSIHDLIYCVMLPSGNDAAQALAESLGVLMYKLSKGARSYSLFEYIK